MGILKGRHQQIAVQVNLPVRFCPRVRPQAHNTVAVYPYLLVRNIHLVLLQCQYRTVIESYHTSS